MKITEQYLLDHPDACVVLRKTNLDTGEITSIHYAYHEFSMDWFVGMDMPDWMIWPNREVAEFAAKLFTRLYGSVDNRGYLGAGDW